MSWKRPPARPGVLGSSHRAILARLRSMTAADFAALDQGREGHLESTVRRLPRCRLAARTLLAAAKTKRYAMARLRRMVLWSYLGLTPGDMPERVPYLRVLAANGTGCRLLSRMREAAAVPVLTRPAQVRRLGPEARRLFELEVRATDLYTLAYPRPLRRRRHGVEGRSRDLRRACALLRKGATPMKRMIALLLLLCMLTACAAPVPETEEPTAASQEIAVPEQKQPDSGTMTGAATFHSGCIRALDLYGGSEDAGGQRAAADGTTFGCALPMSFRR